MKEYKIELDTELQYATVDGTPASEEEIILQVWQDLKRLGSDQKEDKIIRNLLEQIMVQKYNGLDNVPYPDYYEEKD